MNNKFKYDIALSAASEDSEYVTEVADLLEKKGINSYYYKLNEIETWGEDVSDHLHNIFSDQAAYTIIFVSEHYIRKAWTDLERQIVQSSLINRKTNHILVARFDDTPLKGILCAKGFIDLTDRSPREFVRNVADKLIKDGRQKNGPETSFFNAYLNNELKNAENNAILEGHSSVTDWFVEYNLPLSKPLSPPKSKQLYNYFFQEHEIYHKTINALINGEMKTGITGFLGMGGVGKTYTALKISWQLIERHHWQVVWVSLLRKNTEEVLDELAKSWGLLFTKSLEVQEKVIAIKHLFEVANTQFSKLLVVLDNAENFPRIELLLQALDDVQLLITTRRRLPSDLVKYREIAPLEGEAALSFCKMLLKFLDVNALERDEQDLITMSKILGGHPLAIRLALSKFAHKPKQQKNKDRPFKYLNDELSKDKIKLLVTESESK